MRWSKASVTGEERQGWSLNYGLILLGELGAVIMYGINSAATAMANSEEFKNDPRNPNAKTPKPADKH
ncbi:hypothetical protein BCON_0221g00090 [Botryotinia convoluta]|uniref:Uncharacterized protein n=1 Tax=Botryotinia convoluta TaxID=54673 RepID=A0A4Z1HWH6_9HELO|nr:hypothetical protein BCON_0221g00090 [Botryotinia convoluta]